MNPLEALHIHCLLTKIEITFIYVSLLVKHSMKIYENLPLNNMEIYAHLFYVIYYLFYYVF